VAVAPVAILAGCSAPPVDREDAPVRRIVSLLPNATQFVVALGGGDRLVGCTAYDPTEGVNPEAVVLGGALDTNFEKILALAPDLVLVQDTMTQHVNRLAALGLRVEPLPAETIADADTSIRLIARRLGEPRAGVVLADRLQRELKIVRERVAEREAVRTLLVIGHDPGQLRGLVVAAPGTFLDELLTVAGGVNVVGKTPAIYPQLSREALLAANPDAVVVFLPHREDVPDVVTAEKNLWRQMPYLQAVKNDRVHVVTDFFALSPGTDMGRTARRLADELHRLPGDGS